MIRPTIENIRRRGLQRAGLAGLVAVAAELPHGLQDINHRFLRAQGLTHAEGYVGVVWLVIAGAAAAWAAMLGRRWAARPLLALALVWTIGSVADHPGAFAHPGSFRTGILSAMTVWVLFAANIGVIAWTAAPSAPRGLDELKIDPVNLSATGMTVLDVRTGWERHRHPLAGAVPADVRHPERALSGDADEVAIVCSHGGRSLIATRRLRRLGIAARSVAGGERMLRVR
ncbi:MAG: hypothetical protein NVS3B12_04760 [Acidimicrobiales bacterium]